MSSAHNHMVRSHRSYKRKAAAFNNLQRTNYIRHSTGNHMKNQGKLFEAIMKMFRKSIDT